MRMVDRNRQGTNERASVGDSRIYSRAAVIVLAVLALLLVYWLWPDRDIEPVPANVPGGPAEQVRPVPPPGR